MTNNLNNCIEKLLIISKIKDPNLRKKVLVEVSDDCLYKALKEIAINTVGNKVPLTKVIKNQLKKYRKNIIDLSKNTQNKIKRKKLVVQSGGFLPILIPAIASIITTLLAKK